MNLKLFTLRLITFKIISQALLKGLAKESVILKYMQIINV